MKMRMGHVSIKSSKDLEKVSDPRVRKWLQGSYTNPVTMNVVHRVFVGWYNWLQDHGGPEVVDKSPDELVKLQNELNRKSQQSDDEDNTLIFGYLVRCLQESDWSYGFKRKVYSTVRGFFDSSCANTGGFPKLSNGQRGVLKGEMNYEKKSMEDFEGILKEVVGASDRCHQAVFAIMAVSGMGEGELIQFSKRGIKTLMEQIRNPPRVGNAELIEVKLGSRKQNLDKPYYSYIGGHALQWLKIWIQEREQRSKDRGDFPNDVFVTTFDTPLTVANLYEYWKNCLIRKGRYVVQHGRGRKRTGSNPHLIRHLFLTKWEESKAKRSFGDYFLGHFEKLPYNEIHESRDKRIKEYGKALPFVDVWAEKKIDEEIEQLQAKIHELEAKKSGEVEELRAEVRKSREELVRVARLVEAMSKKQDL
jgi:hypothetical protein